MRRHMGDRLGMPESDALPRLAALHHSTFVLDDPLQSTVELDKHRSASNLDELDLDNPHADKAA